MDTLVFQLPIPADLRTGPGGTIVRVGVLFHPGKSVEDPDLAAPEILVETEDNLYVNPMEGFAKVGINTASILSVLLSDGQPKRAARVILTRFHAATKEQRDRFRLPEYDDGENGANPNTIH